MIISFAIFFYFTYANATRVLSVNKNLVQFTLKSILEDGGEGVILRKRYSLFENGRSRSLVKLKVLFIYFEIDLMIQRLHGGTKKLWLLTLATMILFY